ncbi:MAG: DUF3592 domain-containing protein [Parachlamydiaceae bacterium]|nr:DUF3592 domain-containing protein [Parachlamydiaceae bacterium]
MHKNTIYRAFLLAVILVTLWYSGIAIYRYYNYGRLTAQASLTSSEWQIQEVAEDEFYLEATYKFSVRQQVYAGRTSWPREFYRNRWAAEKDIPYVQKHHSVVWYQPSNPTHSSLQKKFPLKECLSAIVLWGLLLYFTWLGFYITRFKP